MPAMDDEDVSSMDSDSESSVESKKEAQKKSMAKQDGEKDTDQGQLSILAARLSAEKVGVPQKVWNCVREQLSRDFKDDKEAGKKRKRYC
eukprot:gene4079-2920_t